MNYFRCLFFFFYMIVLLLELWISYLIKDKWLYLENNEKELAIFVLFCSVYFSFYQVLFLCHKNETEEDELLSLRLCKITLFILSFFSCVGLGLYFVTTSHPNLLIIKVGSIFISNIFAYSLECCLDSYLEKEYYYESNRSLLDPHNSEIEIRY